MFTAAREEICLKKICIIAPVHQYNDVRVFQKEAKALSMNGFNVTIIAKSNKESKIDGIKIIPVQNYKNRLERILLQPLFLYKALSLKCDIYHIHNPETIFLGFILKIFGKKVIYDTHEDFSKRVLIKNWIPKPLRKPLASFIKLMEYLASYIFDMCIVTQKEILSRMGSKSIIIENAPIAKGDLINKAYEISETKPREAEVFRLIYVGGISKARGILEIIKSLELVNKYINVRLWLIGPSGRGSILEEASLLEGWKYVDYLGPLRQEEAFSYMIQANIGIVTILNVGDHSQTSPNKLYEYMTFKLPFIASDFNLWKEKIMQVKSGFFVNPKSINEISDKIIWLLTNQEESRQMGINGYNYVMRKYNWDIESKKLLEIYRRIS
ncbi:glycosyl transferase family 1 [Virgibacillus indicus]|uniref:Glycosyl transferase family 1 n=1 Tax=Virgibacillus indicus TaxID=2024554 RepID=A0A265N9W1_9BACI|nr:glycosyltransferase family 4 protein [Virgibacillus indicus]OZU88239.1 glycosyl transferase family 1 [Virgibacillus indicus]